MLGGGVDISDAKEGTGSSPAISPAAHLAPHQWRPGQSGNPSGRPKDQARLLAAALRTVSEEDVTAIFRSLIRMATAKRPSVKAAEVVLAYTLGKPTQTVELGAGDSAALSFVIVRRDDPTQLVDGSARLLPPDNDHVQESDDDDAG